MDLEARRERYAAALLQRAIAGVSADAGRNCGLNAAAFALGRAVAGGMLARGAAAEALLAAAAAVGLDAREARYTIRRSLAQGEREPRSWPATLDGSQQPQAWPRLRRRSGAPRGPQRPAPILAPAPEPEAPKWPPWTAVGALWLQTVPCAADTGEALEAAAWLRSRGLDAAEVDRLELARVLPPARVPPEDLDAAEDFAEREAIMLEGDGEAPEAVLFNALRCVRPRWPSAALRPCPELPPWAAVGRLDWRAAGYLLCCPAWTAGGALASLHARRVRGGAAGVKGAWPRGYAAKGTVLANRAGLALLRGGSAPLAVVCEGLPDYLTGACCWPEVAVLGIAAGSVTPALGARLAAAEGVLLAADPDAAGDRYAAALAAEIPAPVEIRRAALEADLNATHCAGGLPSWPAAWAAARRMSDGR